MSIPDKPKEETRWTTTPPTQPGAYWLRIGINKQEPVMVWTPWPQNVLCVRIDGVDVNLSKINQRNYSWWPMPLPEPPTQEEGS